MTSLSDGPCYPFDGLLPIWPAADLTPFCPFDLLPIWRRWSWQEVGLRCLVQLGEGSEGGGAAGLRCEVMVQLGIVRLMCAALEGPWGQGAWSTDGVCNGLGILEGCCALIEQLCSGADATPRRRRVAEEGALDAIVQVALGKETSALPAARAALTALTSGQADLVARAMAAGISADWLGK